MRTVFTLIFASLIGNAAFAQDKDLVAAIQLELNRLGCNAGQPDGLWGPGSRKALTTYAQKTGTASLSPEPSDDLLVTLRAENGRLCTLPPGIVAAKNRAETSHLEAVKYSYKVWGSLPSRVATKDTEYGVLRCQAGNNDGPRSCNWQ